MSLTFTSSLYLLCLVAVVVASLLLAYASAATSIVCEDLTNTSCTRCHGAGIVDGCDWCDTTKECKSKGSVFVSCPITWVREEADCDLLNTPPPCTQDGLGCTNLNAWNYDFHAQEDDGSCVYENRLDPMPYNDTGCSGQCVCGSGGLLRPYGKFCSNNYYGCHGDQPCDALDLCCQMHDWCVTVESNLDCECGYMLHSCVAALTDEDFAASFCPEGMKVTAETIKVETKAQILVECWDHQFYSKCGPTENCNNVGECLFNGGCDCGGTSAQHFAYDQFGRTNCKCEPGWYPLCGETADTICNVYCDPATTCNNVGECSPDGTCSCFAGYTGVDCSIKG